MKVVASTAAGPLRGPALPEKTVMWTTGSIDSHRIAAFESGVARQDDGAKWRAVCCLFVCLFVCLFACVFVCLLVCLFVWLFVCLMVCLFVCLFVGLSVWLSCLLLLCAWILLSFLIIADICMGFIDFQ